MSEQKQEFENENAENSEHLQDENLQNIEDVEQNKLQKDYDELKDKYMRANAEFENIKKRMEKEKLSAMAYANESFAKDLLDVLDALEAAVNVECQDEISLKIKEGVQNTLDLFLKKLGKHDPNLHEAMFHVDSENHQSGEVVQVLQKGYKIADRVIRPTKVSVAK